MTPPDSATSPTPPATPATSGPFDLPEGRSYVWEYDFDEIPPRAEAPTLTDTPLAESSSPGVLGLGSVVLVLVLVVLAVLVHHTSSPSTSLPYAPSSATPPYLATTHAGLVAIRVSDSFLQTPDLLVPPPSNTTWSISQALPSSLLMTQEGCTPTCGTDVVSLDLASHKLTPLTQGGIAKDGFLSGSTLLFTLTPLPTSTDPYPPSSVVSKTVGHLSRTTLYTLPQGYVASTSALAGSTLWVLAASLSPTSPTLLVRLDLTSSPTSPFASASPTLLPLPPGVRVLSFALSPSGRFLALTASNSATTNSPLSSTAPSPWHTLLLDTSSLGALDLGQSYGGALLSFSTAPSTPSTLRVLDYDSLTTFPLPTSIPSLPLTRPNSTLDSFSLLPTLSPSSSENYASSLTSFVDNPSPTLRITPSPLP